ncbi:MAG: hypothetical protein WCC92_10405 [Candidatus Korobacteraceae bacterium]
MTTELARGGLRCRALAGCASLLFVVAFAVAELHAVQPASPAVQSASQASKSDYALIYGTVWGPDERPEAGVPVTIRPASAKKAKWELMSDSRGEFAQRVPVGGQDYIIQANIKMPKGRPKPEITVHIDDNERKDVSLHLSK